MEEICCKGKKASLFSLMQWPQKSTKKAAEEPLFKWYRPDN
jgi:hypothetical protein